MQERDPRSYQLFIQLSSGAAFFGITPENLYTKTGRSVASEAVAATRPRGPPGMLTCRFPMYKDAHCEPCSISLQLSHRSINELPHTFPPSLIAKWAPLAV